MEDLKGSTNRKRLGLIVNPIAGLGGRVGLKGSDTREIQRRALELGAVPEAGRRAAQALALLEPLKPRLELLTPPGEMGEAIAQTLGWSPRVIGSIDPGDTTAEDTRRLASAMLRSGVDLLLFAGGDGTARDICHAVSMDLPALGIPAGVKIHSACFAVSPARAGELALEFLLANRHRLREAEVVDLDEDAYRSGVMSTRLYGYLKVPYRRSLVQNQKAPTPEGETAQLQAIATAVVEGMLPDWLYILGPGTTTRHVADRLGLGKTLVGVDVVTRDRLVASDVSERRLLELVEGQPAKIAVAPIGGQGFIFGRGNQQISPRVIQAVGRDNILVLSLPEKLDSLRGRPLLVDTGDPAVDRLLSGYLTVITGYRERAVYRVAR